MRRENDNQESACKERESRESGRPGSIGRLKAGAQPSSGAESPMPPLDPKYPDLPATEWYEYGFKEGLPRLLDMFAGVVFRRKDEIARFALSSPQTIREGS